MSRRQFKMERSKELPKVSNSAGQATSLENLDR